MSFRHSFLFFLPCTFLFFQPPSYLAKKPAMRLARGGQQSTLGQHENNGMAKTPPEEPSRVEESVESVDESEDATPTPSSSKLPETFVIQMPANTVPTTFIAPMSTSPMQSE